MGLLVDTEAQVLLWFSFLSNSKLDLNLVVLRLATVVMVAMG